MSHATSALDSPSARSLPADHLPGPSAPEKVNTGDLLRVLSEVKGQAQFLLYLADQIEDSLQQLHGEADPGHTAFLCRVLSMYGNQLEAKYQSLGDKVSEACQDVYLTVRELDLM